MHKDKYVCIDANTAVAYIAYALSDVACIYPITPSTPMAESVEEFSATGILNIFNKPVLVKEMQSEAGVAGAIHGAASSGALSSTYTCSQGLLLMIPNMYKIAGELLPAVFHVASRSIATNAINIFNDHSDVMATRQTGFCVLASNNVQEAMDMATIAHISAIKASLPFLHFFDGFRTSHEISKIKEVSYETIKELLPIKELEEFKNRSHSPLNPKLIGIAANNDTYMQYREASNVFYDKAYSIVEQTMGQFAKHTGRAYKPFMYYGSQNATNVIVSMCSSNDTIIETINHLNSKGNKYGLVCVHLYRPFNTKAFVNTLPNSVKTITVLDRTKEQGSAGEPLYLDVLAAINEHKPSIKVLGGRYGIGGKEFTPIHVASIFENMQTAKPINHFSVGIEDDITFKSLPSPKNFNGLSNNYYECQFWGLGSDGTVSANKNSIKIIGENTNKHIQGFFEYDSKKSHGLTISHLRVSDSPILSRYNVYEADFIAIHNYGFINKYDILSGLKNNGIVLLNTSLNQQELATNLPQNFKDQLKQKQAKLFIIDATKVASNCNLKNTISTIMQSCFFKITNIIDYKLANKKMKDFASKSYIKKGIDVVNCNIKAIDAAINSLIEVDINKIINTKSIESLSTSKYSKYFQEYISLIERRKGNQMPTSCFNPDGAISTGTSKFEKRGISSFVPKWIPEKCIQCGQCIMVCPHAAIRSKLFNDKQDQFTTVNAIGTKDKQFRIQVSPLDCTGCKNCVFTCPVKALEMDNQKDYYHSQVKNWEHFINSKQEVVNPFDIHTVKGIQFEQPYFEFSGACSGCGETTYIKLATQLFGSQMIIANATGCSSIYSSSSPTCAYTTNKDNEGPSWANSLFEDNAEFGYGMALANKYRRAITYEHLLTLSNKQIDSKLKSAISQLLANFEDTKLSKQYAKLVQGLLKIELEHNKALQQDINNILKEADLFAKRSIWIIGGDGWAYDIGFGGVDHILASNEDVNILVLDNEGYSNTGGQASKATPIGSIAKLATNGKSTPKKNLAAIAMTYKNAYVAQISLGANKQQAINAMVEAENHKGPSIIIAYAPCINHGIDMSHTQQEMKQAVECGYWSLFRYDPTKTNNKLSIDSALPTGDITKFLTSENRYARLYKKDKDKAIKIFKENLLEANNRLETIKAIANKK